MAIATGDILATWDDDDFFGARRLEIQAAPIVQGFADVTGFPVREILTVPDGRFWRWKAPGAIPAGERRTLPTSSSAPVPFHDGSAMYKRKLLEGVPDRIREAAQLELLEEFQRRGARLRAVENDGAFVYVRHGSNGWAFKTEDRCEPVDRPPWFSDVDLAFYKNPELVKR
jgi:hypothetical protein